MPTSSSTSAETSHEDSMQERINIREENDHVEADENAAEPLSLADHASVRGDADENKMNS